MTAAPPTPGSLPAQILLSGAAVGVANTCTIPLGKGKGWRR